MFQLVGAKKGIVQEKPKLLSFRTLVLLFIVAVQKIASERRKLTHQADWDLTTQMKSLDMTTFRLLKFRKANPVGILAGSILQNGLAEGFTTTSSSSSTKESKKKCYILVSLMLRMNTRCLLRELKDEGKTVEKPADGC